MNILSLSTFRSRLEQFEVQLNSDPEKNVSIVADDLIKLLTHPPSLAKNKKTAACLIKIVDILYSRKDSLTSEKQCYITKMFYSVHHIRPQRFENLLLEEMSVKDFVNKHGDAEAFIQSSEDYPLARALLKGEVMSCKKYFSHLPVVLDDGTHVEVCRGFLAHFSPMVHTLNEYENSEAIKLPLNRNQFEILMAFLETNEMGLINKKNLIPLLHAGDFLQIPAVKEACKRFVIEKADGKDCALITEALNFTDSNDKDFIAIEYKIAEYYEKGCQAMPYDSEFLATLDYYKNNLIVPIALSIMAADIEPKDLSLLKGLPLHKLGLIDCKRLSKECLTVIGEMAGIKELNLGGNPWVDDDALTLIPANIKELSISRCSKFGEKGLAALRNSNVASLDLAYCKHLKDDDFTGLTDHFQKINLRDCSGLGVKGMQALSQFKNLRSLLLNNTFVNDEHAHLLPLSLHYLDLSGCALTSEGLKYISQMEKLRSLVLRGSEINDEGIAHLPQSISYLTLENCFNLTNNCIETLANYENLQQLNIARCPKISIEAFSKLPKSVQVDFQGRSLANILTHALR